MINIFTSNDFYSQIFRNFVMGGTIVASVSYLATFMNPVAAAIWWSFPLSIIPSMYFMKQNGKNNKYIAKFLLSTTFALSLLVTCTYLISYYLKHSNEKDGITPSILKSTVWWVFFSILFYLFIEYGGYKQYFM